jgi:hypothetical protein
MDGVARASDIMHWHLTRGKQELRTLLLSSEARNLV